MEKDKYLSSEFDPNSFNDLEEAYLFDREQTIRHKLIQLKIIDDLIERTNYLAEIFSNNNPADNADLLVAAYDLANQFSVIGELTLLSVINLDRLKETCGIITLQGLFDELQDKKQFDLARFIFRNVMFKESTQIFSHLVVHCLNLFRAIYEMTKDEKFKLTIPQLVYLLQRVTQKQGLRELTVALSTFFLEEFEFNPTQEELDQITTILFDHQFRHVGKDVFVLYTVDIIPLDYAPILIPAHIFYKFELYEWENVISEDQHEKLDDIVIEARRRFEHLRAGERVEIARKVKGSDLKKLTYDKSPVVFKALLENPQLIELDVINIALRHTTSGEILQAIAESSIWINRYPVKNALAKNANTPRQLAIDLIPHLLQEDLLDIISRDELSWIVRRYAYLQIRLKLETISLADILELATQAHYIINEILLRKQDERILNILFYHDRLDEGQILQFLRWEKVSANLLEHLGDHIYWSESHPIKLGLLHHHHTPPKTRYKLLEDITPLEMKILCLNNSIDDAFLQIVKRKLDQLSQENTPNP